MLTQSAIDGWRRLLPFAPRRITAVLQVTRRDQLPNQLHPRRLYLVGSPAKWAMLRCPCGFGHDIDLNLGNPARARWIAITERSGRPTVRPSIDVRTRRRCHFWLRNGRVTWCVDRRSPA